MLKSLLAARGIAATGIKRMHARAEAVLDAERQSAERESGRQLADLNLYFVIDLPASASTPPRWPTRSTA